MSKVIWPDDLTPAQWAANRARSRERYREKLAAWREKLAEWREARRDITENHDPGDEDRA